MPSTRSIPQPVAQVRTLEQFREDALVTPRLTARYGYRLTLAVGLILLGAPALALTGPANLAVVMAVCIVRGLGFAITVVAGGAITASLIPAERRGEGLALAGVVSGVPALAALPLGVWLAGLISASLGMMLLALTAVPAALIAGSLIFGLGFGVAQNASLSLMYERAPASGYDAVSALWNLSYDAGMGLGAAGFGLFAGFTGYPIAFAAVAAAMLIALFPARRDRVTAR